jgi:diguanylate cyclase (GGDEF)-like protein
MIFPADLEAGGIAGRTAFNAVALLLPINLAAYSLLSERGVITRRAAARLIPLLGQGLAVGLLGRFRRPDLDTLLSYRLAWVDLAAWTPIPQPALLAFGVAFVLLTTRFFLIRNPIERSFVWALAGAFAALQAGHSGWSATALFATSGLILGVSVVEMSYRMAYYDELTGLPGRRALNETLLKLGSQYAVGMVDVDHFKQFNDQYGHDVGDQVLRMVAAKLERVSGGGKAFRHGGEEFAVVFPGQTAEEVLPHLESLRREVQASCFVLRAPDRPKEKPTTPKAPSGPRKAVLVTVSVGVAAWDDQKRRPDHVIKAADLALYRAKAAGRNKVIL